MKLIKSFTYVIFFIIAISIYNTAIADSGYTYKSFEGYIDIKPTAHTGGMLKEHYSAKEKIQSHNPNPNYYYDNKWHLIQR